MNTYTQNLLNKATEINANIEIDPTSGVITLFNDILTNFYGTLSDTHMIKLIAFSGLGLILAKILYHFFTNGKIQPLANYILREEPWEFGWYMAVIFIFKHTTFTIGDSNK